MEAICFRIEGFLGNYETALYSGILPGNINRNGFRRIAIHRISVIDYWWNYCTCDITFLKEQEEYLYGIRYRERKAGSD